MKSQGEKQLTSSVYETWPTWYRNSNVFEIAINVIVKLQPQIWLCFLIYGICLVSCVITVEFPPGFFTLAFHYLIVFAITLAFLTIAAVGYCLILFLTTLTLAVIDKTMGRVLPPTVFSAFAVGCPFGLLSTISISFFNVAFDPATDHPSFIFQSIIFLSAASFGVICGIWGAATRICTWSSDSRPIQYSLKQLIVFIAWISVILIADGGKFFVVSIAFYTCCCVGLFRLIFWCLPVTIRRKRQDGKNGDRSAL